MPTKDSIIELSIVMGILANVDLVTDPKHEVLTVMGIAGIPIGFFLLWLHTRNAMKETLKNG